MEYILNICTSEKINIIKLKLNYDSVLTINVLLFTNHCKGGELTGSENY